MRTAQFARGYTWEIFNHSVSLLIANMAEQGFVMVEIQTPVRCNEPDGQYVCSIIFDTALQQEEISVVFVDGPTMFSLNENMASLLASGRAQGGSMAKRPPGKLIKIGEPYLIQDPGMGKMVVVALTFSSSEKKVIGGLA